MKQVVDHVVLFRAKEGISRAATDAWAEALTALADLDGILKFSVGAVISCKPDVGAWSFALYGRYRDKAALDAYATHPRHLQVVALGRALFSDVMALDWEAHSLSTTDIPTSCPALTVRLIFCQWKRCCAHEDIASVTSYFNNLPHSTSGPNFSPGRARGFEWGCATMYGSADEAQDDGNFVETLSTSAAVEKFLLVDVATTGGRNADMKEVEKYVS